MPIEKIKREAPFQISGHDPRDARKFNGYAAKRGMKRGVFFKYLIKLYEDNTPLEER